MPLARNPPNAFWCNSKCLARIPDLNPSVLAKGLSANGPKLLGSNLFGSDVTQSIVISGKIEKKGDPLQLLPNRGIFSFESSDELIFFRRPLHLSLEIKKKKLSNFGTKFFNHGKRAESKLPHVCSVNWFD